MWFRRQTLLTSSRSIRITDSVRPSWEISMPVEENSKQKIGYKKAGVQALIAPFQMSNKLIRQWLKLIFTHQYRKMLRFQLQEMHLKILASKVLMIYKNILQTLQRKRTDSLFISYKLYDRYKLFPLKYIIHSDFILLWRPGDSKFIWNTVHVW